MSRAFDTIQTFNLFGDDGDLPDVVHCETIEARSRLHDWEFTPHRHGALHQVLLLEDGGGRASLDGVAHVLRPPLVVNVPRGIVHGYAFEPGARGLVITLAVEMLDESLRPEEGLGQLLGRAAVLGAADEIRHTMHDIAEVFATRAFARAHILRAQSALLLGQIAQMMSESELAAQSAPSSALLARFEALVDKQFAAHWSVRDYADALAVSPTHLSRIARQATGRPASKLIEERLMREARRNLVYTNLPVSTIAYALGFDDPAYFSRVFARATGLSPRKFRDRAAS
ncbi:helix-turn-helix domain-containing protein [Rhodobacteraceae bacterium D3-12]|nr:helix-turn-helix domain-containing protein [Rhodobacteraceae bacterium D3-12]